MTTDDVMRKVRAYGDACEHGQHDRAERLLAEIEEAVKDLAGDQPPDDKSAKPETP